MRPDREVERVTELQRQVAAQPAERWQPLTHTPRRRPRTAAADRVHAREPLVEAEPERIEIGLPPHVGALGLLGRHVGQGPDDVAGQRERVVARDPRHTEVRQLGRRPTIGDRVRDQDVQRLDVAVDDPALVGVGQRVAERDADLDHIAIRQRALFEQPREGRPADQLGDEVDALAVGLRLVQRDDRRMLQPSAATPSRLARRAASASGTAIRLTATVRSSFWSWASQTTPKPPPPSLRTRR